MLLFAVATAGCSGGDDDGDDGAAATTTTASGRAGSDTTGTTDPTIRVVLQPARLTVGGNALPFGAPEFQVSSFLERALGEPEKTSEGEVCGPGEVDVIQWPSLTVYVAAEGLAGWYTDDDSHTTDKAVSVGSSASDLQRAYPTGTTSESSLGTEFFFDAGDGRGLSAVLEGGDVSTLWSGVTCIAR